MIALLHGVIWAVLWLICGAGGVWLLSTGNILGVVPLVVFMVTGVEGAAKALGK